MSRNRFAGSMPVASIYPSEFVQRLVLAAATHDTEEINRVVDELHKRGFCERRASASFLHSGGKGK